MRKIEFKTNLARRASGIDLPLNRFLLPLFEAISNSIHAIGDNIKDGCITITINRDNSQHIFPGSNAEEAQDIIGFDIYDNGEGFTEKNYNSFLTDYSPLKENIGGKGVGRFTWLKAFNSVEIDSCFKENDSFYKRYFYLDQKTQNEKEKQQTDDKKSYTMVSLRGYKKDYRKIKRMYAVCDNIIEHFLPYFYEKKAPSINVIDGTKTQNLNKTFQEEILSKSSSELVVIENIEFKVVHLFHKKQINGAYKINLCACERFVDAKMLENIDAYFTDLSGRTLVNNDDNVYYSMFVFSDFLNANVNNERTKFRMPETLPEGAKEITLEKIYKPLTKKAKILISPFITDLQESKITRVKSYIDSSAPSYRHLLGYMKDELEKISLSLDNDKLELELHRVGYEFEKKVKEKGIKISNTLWESDDDYKKISSDLDDYIEKEYAIGKSRLTSYVIHRKAILHIFEKALSLNMNEKYSKEDIVHKIICPMGHESTEIAPDHHNLWLVDERMVYHNFLASDKPIATMPDGSNSKREPDLVSFFDNPMAFGDENDSRAGVIIEFKRPMRSEYTMHDIDKDPIYQIGNYSLELQKGTALDPHGRPMRADSQIYAYLVCDITEKLADILLRYNFQRTYDNQGFYIPYHGHYKCYMEIISYNKLLEDAKKRNTILFDKLGIRKI